MTKFTFLGFASFLIHTSDGKRILIDPYLNDNPASPLKSKDITELDLLLVSHAAFDHLGDSADIAIRTGCDVICGSDTKAVLLERGVDARQIQETVWGLAVRGGGILVRPVESRHRSAATLADGRQVTALPLGFIITLADGTKIYNASDTAIFSDMKLIGELYAPDIGLINATIENPFDFLPTFLTGEMTAAEAALASKWLRLKYAVACHYTVKDCPDIDEFCALLRADSSGPVPVALNPGETWVYPPAERL